jgi:hypothetical protein
VHVSYAPAAVSRRKGGAEPEVDLLAVRLGPDDVLQTIGVAERRRRRRPPDPGMEKRFDQCRQSGLHGVESHST